MLPGAVAAYVVIGPVVATPPAVWRPMDAARGWQGGLACWRCRSCCRAARCLVVDGPRSEAHERSAQDNHNDQATVATSSKPKTATATTLALLKTGDTTGLLLPFTAFSGNSVSRCSILLLKHFLNFLA